ncbi:hypothetical protein ABGB07_32195 [Micromonosporaceae bacterium B7E4]
MHELGQLRGRPHRRLRLSEPVAGERDLGELPAVAAGARDQELVLLSRVVFLSFLAGLSAMAVFSHSEGRRVLLAINVLAEAGVSFTLVVSLSRGDLLVSLAAALMIAAGLYWLWFRAGRPRGIRHASARSGG